MINLSECPLLQQIPDVWPIINYYYESYFPFAIGRLCNLLEQISLVQKNNYYREVTLEESKTDRFKKLFIQANKDNKIIHYIRNRRIYIDGYPLVMKFENETRQIWSSSNKHFCDSLVISDNYGFTEKIIYYNNDVYVNESDYYETFFDKYRDPVPLLVLCNTTFYE